MIQQVIRTVLGRFSRQQIARHNITGNITGVDPGPFAFISLDLAGAVRQHLANDTRGQRGTVPHIQIGVNIGQTNIMITVNINGSRLHRILFPRFCNFSLCRIRLFLRCRHRLTQHLVILLIYGVIRLLGYHYIQNICFFAVFRIKNNGLFCRKLGRIGNRSLSQQTL